MELDARGLLCPLPVLKARKRLGDMAEGECLAVLADDPAASLDFAHFCESGGHQLLEEAKLDNGAGGSGMRFLIRKGSKNG